MHKLIEGTSAEESALAEMRERGGTWAVYQNLALDHSHLGHVKFLRYGEGCTFATPPPRHPDMPGEVNWAYMHVGYVDLATGKIEPEEKKEG